jgi:integrase/recombinase XerD
MSAPVLIREAIDDYLAAYATRIKPNTLELQRIYLKHHFLEWITGRLVFDLRAVTQQHLEEYDLFLTTVEYRWRDGMKRIAPSSRAERFAAVRRFFAWAVSTRVLLVDPSLTIKQAPRKRWQPDNVLTEAETVMVLESADLDTPIGLRDRAILELVYSTGLRCAEVNALDLTDVDLTECIVFVRCGKGSKQRIVPVGEPAVEAVRQYLTHARPLFLKHPGVRALFIASWRCGDMGKRLSRASILLTVQRAAKKAGITRRVTTHTLRHSVATHMLRAGADLRYVQELLGHNRIDTTECYTHLDVSDLGEAHVRSHPRGKQPRTKSTG